MTCIVGIRHKNGVLLGGDALASAGWDGSPRKDVKVFKIGPHIACGFTSSYRMGQILRYHVTPGTVIGDPYKWTVTEFIPALRSVFKEHGYTRVEHGVETGGTFLLAVRDRLFKVDSDFHVGEPLAPFEACGCGESFALGALHAIRSQKLAPRTMARRSLEAAVAFSNGVSPPFTFVETRP